VFIITHTIWCEEIERADRIITTTDAVIQQSLDVLPIFSDQSFVQLLKNQKQSCTVMSDDTDAFAQLKKVQQARFDFYKDYLAKYYPKAFVICEQFFVGMTPDAVEKALQQVIDVFTDQPWFYFVNKPEGFSIAHYWEFIFDQLSWLSEFLNRAAVDAKLEGVFLPDIQDDWWFGMSMFASQNDQEGYSFLSDILTAPGKTTIYNFYALCFDYTVKLFNEGIFLTDSNQAALYYAELEFLAEKLRGSYYEADYQESLKTAKELLLLLKQKISAERINDMMDGGFAARRTV
jgi:hypothetical protein